jgi:YD repeat-containing protein
MYFRTNRDANYNISEKIDYNGVRTTYAYDMARNLETKRVEASGTPLARTTSTEWHNTLRLPLRTAEPKRITTYTYDGKGNVLVRSVQATSDANGVNGFAAAPVGVSRAWTYTYSPLGLLLTSAGPSNDVTTYTYDSAGNLSSVTNPAGHITSMANYDANGKVGRVTDPNGLVTDLTYTPRGLLASKTVGSQSWNYEYDGAGQLILLTPSDSSTITFTYDGAHRLTLMSDSAGNAIAYTLDAMGNRIGESVRDPGGNLVRQTTRAFDSMNRLKQLTGGAQ